MNSNSSWLPNSKNTEGTSDRYYVEVTASKCIGDGGCVAFAPKVFALNQQKIAEVINQTGNLDEVKLLAAQICPTKAIRVIDTHTNTQIWPITDATLHED